MRKKFSEEFYQHFDSGVKFYLEGGWAHSKYQLEMALSLNNKDGPSISLLNLMSENGFQAPGDWENSRYLG